MPEPKERALIESRREEIANILKKYMKEPGNPFVPVTGGSFQENLPTLIKYIARYVPDLKENIDVLPVLLYQIKKYGFKEITGRDLSQLPKEEYDRIVSKVSNIINQYKEPSDRFDVILPPFIHDFTSFKLWLLRHFQSYLPNLFANKPMLENVLKQIEDIFEGTEPKNSTTDNINGLDKNVLLQFVEKYYPEQFSDQDFINELVHSYEQQSKLNVLPTSEPSNDQIQNALLYFFNKVYPKLSIDEQFVKQYTENFKPAHQNHVELSVEMPESETISPTRAEIVEFVKKQVIRSPDPKEPYKINDGNVGQINLHVAATSPVPEVELISVPSRRVMPEELSEESQSSVIDPTIIISPEAVEFVQDPTAAEQKTIRQKILECIKESFPQIYANKPVLWEILKQLEENILSGSDTPQMSLETEMRRFSKAHLPKITVEQSDTVQSFPEEKVIEVEISPPKEEQQKIVEKVYIVKGDAKDVVTNLEPIVSVVKPKERLISIGLKPEMKQHRDTVKNVYFVEGNDSAGKVSLANEKPNQDAVVNVQVTDNSSWKQQPIKVQHNIKLKPNSAFAKASKEEINRYRKAFMMVLKKIHERALRDKEFYKELKIEMPKVKHMKSFGKLEPATGNRFKEYFTDQDTEKLASIQFPYEHHFLPLLIRSYGPLYEKEHRDESLTKDEHLKMKLLEKMFAKNQEFHELYLKKFGPQDKFDIKSMLYNMYKLDLKENDGKLIQIDPMKNVKFLKVNTPELEYFRDEDDTNPIETQYYS
ncbi:hypothetical protein CBL_10202 [Carabus blaptoides fortunei]